MNRSINRGILALAGQGRLSATSCLPKSAAFFDDAPALAELAIEKGLHLNLSEAQPGTRFYQPLPALIRNCYLRKVDTDLIRTEIEEQCDGFEQVFGEPPRFVDGHQHVHQLPVVRELLLPILKRRYGSALPWIRSTRTPRGLAPFGDWLKAKITETLGARSLLRQARGAGFNTSHCLLGVYDFTGDERQYLARLDSWLGLVSTGDVLMCHPACGAEAGDVIGLQREVEFAALSGAALADLLAKHHACIAGNTVSQALGDKLPTQ